MRGSRRRDAYELARENLDEVLGELPERLVVGTGAFGRMRADPELLVELRRRTIEVECLPTGAAVHRYGGIDPARTAAAPQLTC